MQTSYYATVLNERITPPGQNLKAVGHVSISDTGGQTTISGSGEIYENFKKMGKIENYSGFGQTPVNFYDPGFKTAVLRMMNFDESYHGMQYDACRSTKLTLENMFVNIIPFPSMLQALNLLLDIYFPCIQVPLLIL